MLMIDLGDKVQVGGCVGEVTMITSTYIVVEGEWYDFVDSPVAEPWSFKFDIDDIEEYTEFDESSMIWDFTKLQPIGNFSIH